METTTCGVDLTVMNCSCGIVYAVPENWRKEKHRDHSTWYCPNGCPRHYPPGTSPEEKLREQLEREREARSAAQIRASEMYDRAQQARREAAAQKGVATRIKNRVKAGKCPFCCSEESE